MVLNELAIGLASLRSRAAEKGVPGGADGCPFAMKSTFRVRCVPRCWACAFPIARRWVYAFPNARRYDIEKGELKIGGVCVRPSRLRALYLCISE